MYVAPTRDEVREAMREVFDVAVKCERKALWNALYPSDPALDCNPKPGFKMINRFVTYEYHELAHCVFQLKEILENTQDDISCTRFMLAIYCHIMEADFPLAVIWNLLRAIDGQREKWTFQNDSNRVCEFTWQKIRTIKRLSDRLDMRIGVVLDRLWYRDIRNAFSHSQYFIDADYVVLTKGLSPISRRKENEFQEAEENPSLADVHALYTAVDTYFTSFFEEYDMAQERFREAQPACAEYGCPARN